MKIPFPIFGNGNGNGNSIPELWEREWDIVIPGNDREREYHRKIEWKFFIIPLFNASTTPYNRYCGKNHVKGRSQKKRGFSRPPEQIALKCTKKGVPLRPKIRINVDWHFQSGRIRNASAHAHTPHETHFDATAWPSLVWTYCGSSQGKELLSELSGNLLP